MNELEFLGICASLEQLDADDVREVKKVAKGVPRAKLSGIAEQLAAPKGLLDELSEEALEDAFEVITLVSSALAASGYYEQLEIPIVVGVILKEIADRKAEFPEEIS